MGQVAENLVGRAEELAAFDEALVALQRGEPARLLVTGQPGIGKTRLIAELASRADNLGCTVLLGSASELETDLAFWMFVDALDEYVAGLEPRRLERLDDDVRAELARLLPSWSEPAVVGPPPLQGERYRAHRAVCELLEMLAATQPLLLLLDDVHWADPASVELLGAMLRRPPAAPVLVAMAARPRQLPDRLAAAFDRAARGGSLSRLEIAGLDRDQARLLLGDAIDEGTADSLYLEAGGNPFYLEQLARAPRGPHHRGSQDVTMAGVEVPHAVAAALTEELGLLSDPTRAFLFGASVAGDPFEPELAAAAADMDAPAAMLAVDDLLRLDLIRATDMPRRFRFRHPLVRRAVYDGTPGGWLLGAHERCADALAGRGAAASARAHHVEHAAHGDMTAVTVLREAGLEAAARAPLSAARWLGAALRLLPDTAPAPERVALLLARGEALVATGRFEESRADLLECIALTPKDAVDLHVRLTVGCAGVEHMLGRYDEAHARVTEALERMPDRPSPEAMQLLIVLAFDGLFRSDYPAFQDAAERALVVARATGEPASTATAASVAALAHAFAGATTQAEAICTEAAALVDAMTDDELAGRLDAASHLATAELYLDRYDAAGSHADRALRLGRLTGRLFPTLVPTAASVRVVQGRLTEAIELVDGGVESARLADNPQDIGWTLHVRSSAALAVGDIERALSTAEEAIEVTRHLNTSFVTAFPGLALACARLEAGDAAGARDVLVERAGGPELALIPGEWRAMAFELLARCGVALGQRDEAARAAAMAEDCAVAIGLPLATVWARRAQAVVALDAGASGEAAAAALESAACAERAGAVMEAAQSRTLAGQALAAGGEDDRAAAELQRAADEFDKCGARRYRDVAEQELRKLGRSVHRRSRKGSGAGLESLSGRELEVAQLVVARKTNPEIAAELFLSVKTVETHLRNMFVKLGVSSRVEVARVVERAERAT